MAQARPEELTTSHNIINVVETTIVDLIQVNSGTCTGNFAINTIGSNVISNTGKVSTDHLMANSGTLTGKIIAPTVESNAGVFLTNLTVSGLPVRIDSGTGSGITAVVQDPSPVLGGDLNGNSKNITALASITANTGSFPISSTVGTLNSNTISNAGKITTDYLVANSGTLAGKITADKLQTNTCVATTNLTAASGIFNSIATVSGVVTTGTITNLGGTSSTFTNNFGNSFIGTTVQGTTVTGTTGQFGGTVSAQTISAATNLTVSGVPVNIKATPTETISFNLLTTNSGSIGSWKDMPAVATFLMSNPASCQQKDLSGYTQVRINTTMGGAAGAAAARLGLRFRPTSSSPTFTTTINEANWPSIAISDVCRVPVSGTNFPFSSGWQNIISNAKQDVYLAVVGSGGDGVIDPIIGTVSIELRV